VHSAAFSPDGSRIVTASADKTARIWDTASGKEIAVLRGHDSLPPSAPTGRASSRRHGTTPPASGTRRPPRRSRPCAAMIATCGPPRSRIVTASEDTARIWDAHLQTMSVKDLLGEACVHLAGVTKLTREEMRLAGYPDDMSEIDICTGGQ
jgi:WD40 repeat protein